jgi:hypothetical protein
LSSAVVVSDAAYDAPLLAKRNDPAAGTVRSCKLVRTPFFGETAANGLRLGIDSSANELVLDPEVVEDLRAKAAGGERVLHWFECDILDASGAVVARTRKQVYIRRKVTSSV